MNKINIRNTYPLIVLIIGSVHLILVFLFVNSTFDHQSQALNKTQSKISVRLIQDEPKTIDLKTSVNHEVNHDEATVENVVKKTVKEIPKTKPLVGNLVITKNETSKPKREVTKKVARVDKVDSIQPSIVPQSKKVFQNVKQAELKPKLAARKRVIAKYLRLKKSYNQELEEYLGEHRRFPVLAKRFGHEGLVKYKVRIEKDGSFSRIIKLQSSGHDSLDNESLSLLRQASGFKPLPAPLPFLTLNIPIEYKLY